MHLIAILLLGLSVVLSGLSMADDSQDDRSGATAGLQTQPASGVQLIPVEFAQTTPQIPAGQDNGPAQAEPGGSRPTNPPPEPARPDADAQKAGAQPALPAAPAEKVGEPIKK